MAKIVKGTLQPKPFCITWEIERFYADCQNVGDYYKSPIFPMPYPKICTNCYLKVYPNGNLEDNKTFILLYLHGCSKTEIEESVDYQLSFAIEQNSQKIYATTLSNKPCWWWNKTDFAKSNIVKDPKQNILVTLTILCKGNFRIPAEYDIECFELKDDLTSDYEQLLESSSFADVMFNMQDKKINVHKAILSCRSPVFKAMFEHDMKEKKQNSVNVTDTDYEVMHELFRFIYSGKVKNIEKIVRDLLIAADKYQVIELKVLCEKTLYDSITVDNVVEYLQLIDMCDTVHLKRFVIQFVAEHYKEIIHKPGFADLPGRIMHLILEAVAKIN